MIDLKVNLDQIKQAKDSKSKMLDRLRQIDFDNSGVISRDSFLSIAHKYGIFLSSVDIQALNKFKTHLSSKIDYIKVMNELKMKIEQPDGHIVWVLVDSNKATDNIPYRVKIERMGENEGRSKSRNMPTMGVRNNKTIALGKRGTSLESDARVNNTIDFIHNLARFEPGYGG